MIEKFDNILDIKDKFDVFLFDAYGVFWDGSKFFHGTREVMEQLVKEGKIVCVLSNTTRLSEDTIKDYDKKGLVKGIHYNEMITSGEVAKDVIIQGKLIFKKNPNARKVYQFGTPNKKLFEGTNYVNVNKLSDAEMIYISVPQFNEEEYNAFKDKYGNKLFESKTLKEDEPRKWNSIIVEPFMDKIKELLKSGLPVLNANPDYTANEGVKGQDITIFAVRQGYIAEILRKNGAEVVEFGKPNVDIYNYTFNFLKKSGINVLDKSRICMIGDSLRTDIKGANNAGIKSVLCIKTGVTHNEISCGKKLEDLIKANNVVVDYIIQGVAVNSDFEKIAKETFNINKNNNGEKNG